MNGNDIMLDIPLKNKFRGGAKLFDLVMSRGRLCGARHLTTDQILDKLLLQIGKSRKRMQELVKNDPVLMNKVMQARPRDFREIIKTMLDNEQLNIVETLHELKDTDAKGYQSAIQGWAKFAHGTEQKSQVDVNIQEKHTLYSEISEEYRYSEAIDTEIIPQAQLQSPEEMSRQAVIDEYNQTEEQLKEQVKMFRSK